MSTTQEIEQRSQGALVGIIARVASKYDMEAGDFARTMIATIFPRGNRAPEPTKAHVAALCIVAHEYGLNPLLKQVYAFPDKQGGIVPIISVDGWLYLANSSPQYDGMETTFIDDEQGNVIACTCTVYRKDRSHPTTITEYVSECKRNTDPWNKQPRRMIRHRAMIQAIRVAFNISASDPEDGERLAEFEVYPAAAGSAGVDPVAEMNAQLKQGGGEEAPAEDPGEEEQPEAEEKPKRARTPKGFAIKSQREEFDKLMKDGEVDSAIVDQYLPSDEKLETVDDAFAAMSKQDAEALLVRCRAGEFRAAAPKADEEGEAAQPPPADPGEAPSDEPTMEGGTQAGFEL